MWGFSDVVNKIVLMTLKFKCDIGVRKGEKIAVRNFRVYIKHNSVTNSLKMEFNSRLNWFLRVIILSP